MLLAERERSVEEQRAQHQLLLSEQRQLDELGVELQRQEQLRHSARARERLQEQHQKLQQQRNDLLRRQAAGRLQHASRSMLRVLRRKREAAIQQAQAAEAARQAARAALTLPLPLPLP